MGLSEDTRVKAREIIARYPQPRSALLPMLHLVQSEEGYVTPAGVALCAEELGLTKAEVGAVVTFYTMYKRRPTGDYLVSVCTNTLCGVLGGDEIFSSLSAHLGVGHNETVPGGNVTLEHAQCLAACDYAPVVTVNYEFFDNQTPESARELVDALAESANGANDQLPKPTRGASLCKFRDIERLLAGFGDPRPEAINEGPAGEPTLVGLRLAAERGEQAPPYPDSDQSAAGNGAADTRAADTRPADTQGKAR